MSENPKYSRAISLLRESVLSRNAICKQCNITTGEFNAYLQRYHRDLIIARQAQSLDVEIPTNIKLRGKNGQSLISKMKYGEAIQTCKDPNFLECSVSEIARRFKLSPTGLGNQLRAHFPEILKWRLNEQMKLGLCTFEQKHLRDESKKLYSEAIDMLRETEMTIEEVALKCDVSFSGLKQHLSFYHKDLVHIRSQAREKNKGQRYKGEKNGSNSLHVPQQETITRYKDALEMYQNTAYTLREIASKLDISYGGLYGYLRTWHRNLIVNRRGIVCKEDVEIADLSKYKHYLKSSREKYANAIAYMRAHNTSIASTARIFGLHPETFRLYLKEHEPSLCEANGMMVTPEGKKVSRISYTKYKEAIDYLQKSNDSFKAIALKFNLNPISFSGFIRRNYPEIIAKRKKV